MTAPAAQLKADFIADGRAWLQLGMPPTLRVGAAGARPQACRRLVLVEGYSDLAAVQALLQRTLAVADSGDIAVVSMGGVTNIGHALDVVARQRQIATVAVLCDLAEVPVVADALRDLGQTGLFVCRADLEEELIRAIGPDAVPALIGHLGEARRFNTFRQQPSQAGVPLADGLHRFMGTRSARKIQYAHEMMRTVPADRTPLPLADLVAHLDRPL